jgi:L-talarate/galactarate dehydratase
MTAPNQPVRAPKLAEVGDRPLKIVRVSSRIVEVHDQDAFASASQRKVSVRSVVTLRLGVADGVDGIGVAFTLGGLAKPLHLMVSELAELLIGEDASRIEAIRAKLDKAASTGGISGLYLIAVASIDMALWDIRGKVAGLPLWRLAGGYRRAVPGYSSGSIGRDLTDHEAAERARRISESGFLWAKMHLALPGASPQREVERARLVQDAIGPNVRLGCDINERWRADEAIDIGRRLEDVGLAWIEDPCRHDDYRGLSRVTRALSTPIMAGENNLGITPFRIMIEEHSVDILMIDVMLVGGITPWLKVAAMAEAFNLPVVSHLLPEIQAPLVAGIPNGFLSEHKSWIWELFDEVPPFERGEFIAPERPGLGLSFSKRVYGAER